MLTSETASSVSTPSKNHGGDPADERKMPAAAACVSVGELRGALDWPREFRAMRMCDGLVVIAVGLILGEGIGSCLLVDTQSGHPQYESKGDHCIPVCLESRFSKITAHVLRSYPAIEHKFVSNANAE